MRTFVMVYEVCHSAGGLCSKASGNPFLTSILDDFTENAVVNRLASDEMLTLGKFKQCLISVKRGYLNQSAARQANTIKMSMFITTTTSSNCYLACHTSHIHKHVVQLDYLACPLFISY